jgi:protein-S-isoprenylcysteine O-methyltransferase Ste14
LSRPQGIAAKRGLGLIRVVLVLAFIVALAILGRPRPIDVALGVPFVLAGGALRAWAAGYLRKTHELAVGGPYAHVRHPLYLGRLLLLTGFGLMARLPYSLHLAALAAGYVVFFGYYMPRKEQVEGARLEQVHGDTYRTYRDAVHPLLPRLSPYRGPGGASGAWRWAYFARNREALMILLEIGVTGVLAARAFLSPD